MTGIAVVPSELPEAILAKVASRVHDREGRKEVQFHLWESPTLLPVRWDGAMHLLSWGNTSRRSPLPYGGHVAIEHLENGQLGCTRVEVVTIPANLGFHRGTWFLIEEGVRGVVLPEAPGW